MKFNQWTLGLAAVGVVSLASVVQAEEAAKPSSVMTTLSSTMLSGYVDTSAQWNLGTGNLNNPKYAFNTPNKADGFNLNVVKLTLEKPADAADGWGAGYKTDLLFGPDANFFNTTSSGLGNTVGSDFGIKQAYVDLKAPIGNGLDVKLGVFDTIVGYEVFESGNNPNFTRSYGYTIEPTTHTGVLASYQVCDMLGFSAGIANTFGPVINSRAFPTANPFASGPKAESYKTYMGSASFTAPKDWGWVAGSTLYGGIINGFNAGSINGGKANQTSFYAGSTLNTPIQALKLGAAYDYAGVSKQPGVPNSGYANAASFYATYQVTEKMSLNGRAEWFTQSKSQAVTGLPSKVFALTGTLQYDLWKNVISRLEARWDHQADGTGRAYGESNVNTLVTDPLGGSRRNAYEIIANLVYKF
ncbi:outer membrane beta-barrel protein [Pedosphaera parvula]|uniref:Porin n=1 Tax=Pedosphaera parvula (strain Ellin514) TaxID=320771 RepID=B9XQY6_PEDPL|nr:outer membrane beta-barrel protein [Pedosphaera parvula]EEF57763.1 protein of unknown function DUF1597 [Pedosphaera parvula Ellin514]